MREGVLIHDLCYIPVMVWRMHDVWGPAHSGRTVFKRTCLTSNEELSEMEITIGETADKNDWLRKDWRVVSEVEAIALHSMSSDEYLAWLKDYSARMQAK
jgi:hypothetical protein